MLKEVLYGREAWTGTLREEHRLWVLENKLQKKVVVLKTEEARGFPLQVWTGPWGSRTLRLQNF